MNRKATTKNPLYAPGCDQCVRGAIYLAAVPLICRQGRRRREPSHAPPIEARDPLGSRCVTVEQLALNTIEQVPTRSVSLVIAAPLIHQGSMGTYRLPTRLLVSLLEEVPPTNGYGVDKTQDSIHVSAVVEGQIEERASDVPPTTIVPDVCPRPSRTLVRCVSNDRGRSHTAWYRAARES